MQQAKALGEYMKDTHFDAIVASDLKRARWTVSVFLPATPLQDLNQPEC